MPDLQQAAVAAIVAPSAMYAAWALLPAALRSALARRLLRLPLPARLARPLQRAARGGGACGCDGCDAKPGKAAVRDASGPTAVPIRLHRRR
ncbi:hypothetical protein MW290_20020 [Aquincola tertiaricarbonis]|uniref:Uncharacterized protein n=1 Tax=Aquincola tertiaricarbonis TaxID=391953 RepID=A0ABY4SGB2_AQUTE|nr:DUF6587 family protein [Aquincola tertiaricarbonis]URI11246.1 hypothetical protein MW290_20020 [Aquincola tertiaricarbonis]